MEKFPPPGNERFKPLTKAQIDNYYELVMKDFIVHNISINELRKYTAGIRGYCINCSCGCIEYHANGYFVRTTKKNEDGTVDAIISTRDNRFKLSDAEQMCAEMINLQSAQQKLNQNYSHRIEITQRDDSETIINEISRIWEKYFCEERIIRNDYIDLIFDKYKDYFDGETKEYWNKRFILSYIRPLKIIPLNKEAREGTNKLVLIAILAAIQETTGNAFDFEKFVSDNFGILNFQKAKHDHDRKKTYTKIIGEVRAILRK